MENWHALSVNQAFSLLKTKPAGLSQEEAERRFRKFGANKLPEEKRLPWSSVFLAQFKSPLVYILLIAAVICFFLREWIDMGVILAAVILNTLVGFIQENKAEQAIEVLKKAVKQKAKVLRDGREHEIEMEEVVPGDVLLLEAGDKIVADGRLFEAKNLAVVEAALTGESIPSEKTINVLSRGTTLADRENMVYQGTAVAHGKARIVVVATGENTELGKIALMVKETVDEATPLQIQLVHLGRFLTVILSFICLLILVIGFWEGHSFLEMFTTVVAVAVAAVPEGLLVAMTVILAIGMQRILKKKALVRRLIAAETLGSTTVIVSDKTGTLTLGKMQVVDIITWGKKPARVLAGSQESHVLSLKIGLLCNNAVIENPHEALENWKILGDPTERALLLAGISAGLDKEDLEKEMPRVDEIPFEAEIKFMATLHARGATVNRHVAYIKGAPEKLLAISAFVDVDGRKEELEAKKMKEIKTRHENLTKQGLRVLAVGYKAVNRQHLTVDSLKDLVFVGLIALKDPLRTEARETIELCRKAGIRPVVVTGDHRLTAQTIASEIGLLAGKENVLEGEKLDKMSDEELRKEVSKIGIYSRVEPKHKLRIIDALQARGEVVAMTGDGVNDAPALKSADIGIALGGGTDVAKETADIILLDDNFKTIVAAIKEGRVIFENLRKVVLYLLADSFTEVILIGGSLAFRLPLPLLAAQILWINLLEDSLPSMALAFEPAEQGVMNLPPRKKQEPILNLEVKALIFIVGITTDFILFGLFYWLLKTTSLSVARSATFVALGIDTLYYPFCFKSLGRNLWELDLLGNRFLNLTVVFGLVMLVAALHVPFLRTILRTQPLGFREWSVVLALSALEITAIEVTKWIFRKRSR
jgi:Ca2+-transporting ATPase